MGVRFECPAGHKLHVKAELAGKRGICPECGAKFIVPSFSGQRVAEDAGNPPPAPSGPRVAAADAAGSHAAAHVSTATPPPMRQPAAAEPPAEPTAWYIRPASGGQFGPANDEIFAQWVAEGRVSADSWVWRNGWPDWKAGGDALLEFGARAPAAPALAMAAADAPRLVVEEGPAVSVVTAAPQLATAPAAAVDPTSAEARRAEIRRRKKKVRNLSILLGVVALAMLAALVVVLAR